MSWGVAACTIEKNVWGPGKHDLRPIDETHPSITDFQALASSIEARFANWDGMLHRGRLHVKDAGKALTGALDGTVELIWSGEWWPEEVRSRLAQANWGYDSPEIAESYVTIAKGFADICVKHELGLLFG